MKELEQVYKTIRSKLFIFFMAAAEDLTQDVFYEASKSLHRFQGPSPSPPSYFP